VTERVGLSENNISRAATSVGANLEEAQAGETRSDFVHKCGIAQKEIRESLYWLRLLAASRLISANRLRPLERETEELYAVITAIIRNTKAAVRRNKG
jgi:four helix bundle protein